MDQITTSVSEPFLYLFSSKNAIFHKFLYRTFWYSKNYTYFYFPKWRYKPIMVLKITNLHILRYLPTCWLYLLERYTVDNQRCTHTASASVYKIEAKGKDLCEVQFFGKFIMCSNNEDTPVLIEPGETRYWVRKINPLKKWRYEFSSKTNHGNPSISLLSSTPSTNYGQKKQNVVQSATDTTSL